MEFLRPDARGICRSSRLRPMVGYLAAFGFALSFGFCEFFFDFVRIDAARAVCSTLTRLT